MAFFPERRIKTAILAKSPSGDKASVGDASLIFRRRVSVQSTHTLPLLKTTSNLPVFFSAVLASSLKSS